jgi:hypothetical protein
MDAQTGNVVWQSEELSPNMILRVGLDEVASRSWSDLFTWAVAGTGTSLNYISSGTDGIAQEQTLLYQVGTNVINFLTDLELDDTIAYTAASHRRIAGVYNGSQAFSTRDGIYTTGSQSYFIAKTSKTGLDSELKRSDLYIDGDGYCGTTESVSAGTITMRRTMLFTAETIPTTYSEIGFSWGGPGTDLFSRVLLPTPITVDAAYYLLAQYDLTVNYGPMEATYLALPVTGIDGNGWMQHQNYVLSNVELSGTSSGSAALDPYWPDMKGWISDSIAPIVAAGSAIARDTGVFASNDVAVSSYGTASYLLDKTVVFSPAEYSGTVSSLGWGGQAAPGGVEEQYFTYVKELSAEAARKSNLQALSVVFRQSWMQLIGS